MSEKEIRFLVEAYYDVQKLRIATFNRIVGYVKENREKFSSHSDSESNVEDVSQNKNEVQLEVAKGRYAEIAYKIVQGEVSCPEIQHLIWFHNNLLSTEKAIAKKLNDWSKHNPVRREFLRRIRGIGGVLASGIIAWLSPISRFPNISKLWKYCGLAPGQKRKRGERTSYNPKLKTFMWKIATSFEKQKPEKSYYRRLYEQKKEYLYNRPDLKEALEKRVPGIKQRIRLLALRFTVKRFLADLWVHWRKLENLPVTKPYIIDVGKHTGYEEWQPDK
jgi:hypothetical protein